jgi:hypothetical protein
MEGVLMKRRFGPSLYFANDKVIFDSLNQYQVGADLVRELLSERGILVSADTPKDELAKYFSRLTADYYDHNAIAVKLGRVAKRERITSSELTGKFGNREILTALQITKEKLEEFGNKVTLAVEGGRISALIEYEHIDYTKSDLRQVEPRDAIIEFTQGNSGSYVLRSTQNKDIDPVVDEVVALLQKDAGNELTRSRVNMESIANPKIRTQFFEGLIKAIDGYTFITMTEAYCFKPKESSLGGEFDPDEGEELEKSPYVERVSLRGEGVNRSFVIDDLFNKGYYIVKIVWRAKAKSQIDSDIFELEAQFSHPDTCTGFSYRTKSVILCDDGIVTTKRRSPKKDEQDLLFRLIEDGAKKTLIELAK